MFESNSDLVKAFPASIRKEVLAVASALPANPRPYETFSVTVGEEEVAIPQRIYHNPSEIAVGFRLGWRTAIQKEILNCLLTRHADGLIRQKNLSRIVASKNIWVPPFVIQLAGEYVIEILRLIEEALPDLDLSIYERFLRANPVFLALTEQRIISYWNCYYRSSSQEEYPGFRILKFLNSVARNPALPEGASTLAGGQEKKSG